MDVLASEWNRLLVAVFLLGASAIFSAAETAFFSLSRSNVRHLREEGGILSGLVVRMVAHPRRLLVSILLGNLTTGTGILSIAVDLSNRLAASGRGGWAVGTGAGAFVVFIFFGEFLPKGVALNHATGVARLSSIPVFVFETVALPARIVLDRIAAVATGLLVGAGSGRAPLTADELKAFVRLTGSRGGIESEESEMLEDVIGLREVRVREVMIPRVDMVTADLSDGREGVLDASREFLVSKVVIVDGSPDDVRGYVVVKDLLYAPDRPFGELVRKIPAVPEMKSALSLLREFLKTRAPLALVVDEYGGTAGIVAPEDLLEELVGEIGDEYDVRVLPYRQVRPGVAVVSGDMTLRDWEDETGEPLVSAKVETVGGWVMSELGRIPEQGDRIETGRFQLDVIRVRGGRILSILARRRKEGE